MNKLLITLLLCTFSSGLWAQGVISALKGKVEVQNPRGAWVAAQVNDRVTLDTQISTGFNSQATVQLDQNTVLIRPLTRMTLGAYTQKDGLTTTTLRLTSGRVRVNVRSTEERKNNLSVVSAVATASVRGTVFEFSGFELEVEEGVVELVNEFGQEVLVTRGGASVVKKNQNPSDPRKEEETNSIVELVTVPGVPGPLTPGVSPSPKDDPQGSSGKMIVSVE